MDLPFSFAQFIEVFRRYNEAVAPAQLALLGLGVAAVIAAMRPNPRSSRTVAACVAALWLWMGVVYHIAFFRAINPAALFFGVAFILEGVACIWWGARGNALRFDAGRGRSMVVPVLLIGYALVTYPLIGFALGHRYPAAPTFGVPCPTTILTLGVLLLAAPPRPIVLFVVPIAWSILGAVAAVKLGMLEDFGLVAAALIAVTVLARERMHRVGRLNPRSLVAR